MNAIVFVFTVTVLASAQPAAIGPDREAVVAALRHQEALVQTLRVDYERTMQPTQPEDTQLLAKALGEKGKANKGHVYTPEIARHRSGTVRYWRKGDKQREEVLRLDGGRSNRAFDGQVERSVRYDGSDERPFAAIDSGENRHKMPREDPMAFLYYYYEQPLSEVVAKAPHFSSVVVMRGQERFFQVSIRCAPPIEEQVLEFLFNARFLQQERVLKVCFDSKCEHPVSNHKLVFSGYRPYDTPSGDKIWFPDMVTYVAYSMEVVKPDGSPLEVYTKQFRFSNVQFNIDMPDSLFELEIPENARVNDRLTGAGWLDEKKRPSLVFPADSWTRRLWVGAAVLVALAVIVAAYLYRRRRGRAGAAGA